MTLLTICQNAAREAGVIVPTAIISATDQTAKRLLAAAKRQGQSLLRGDRSAPAHDWLVLQKEHTFSTADGTDSYDLPSDFERLISETLWNRDDFQRVRGPLSPQQWQFRKSGLLSSPAFRQHYRIKPVTRVNKFFVDPTPDGIETVAFEYVSSEWCESSAGTAQTDWAADDDVAILDEYLFELGVTWRVKRTLGLDYADEFDEYLHHLNVAIAHDLGGETVSLLGDRGVGLHAVLPESDFG